MYNLSLICADTDAFTVCKPDGNPFTKEETDKLTKELNNIFPENINWEFEFNCPKMIVLKAKNYVYYDGKKIVKKGSSLKSATLEPMLKKFLNEVIEALVFDKQDEIPLIYKKYVEIIHNIEDMTPWFKKLTISETTLKSSRKNEKDIVDAIKGKEYSVGDRIYVATKMRLEETGEFYKRTGIPKTKKVKYLCLKEDFDGKYDKETYYNKLYQCCNRFKTILPIKEIFKKYKEKDLDKNEEES
jgi:hypothetical protein